MRHSIKFLWYILPILLYPIVLSLREWILSNTIETGHRLIMIHIMAISIVLTGFLLPWAISLHFKLKKSNRRYMTHIKTEPHSFIELESLSPKELKEMTDILTDTRTKDN